jgi:PilZ domain
MGAEGTRQHPRVEYRAHVLLLSTGTPGPDMRPLLGRSLNLSASGLLVEADEPCLVGSELCCLIPLGGHTRTLRARVTRLQPLADNRVGIGMTFIDLAASDRALLDGVVAGHETPAELVSVRFDGVAQPLQSRAVVTADGVELRTALPFLRIDSSVEVSFGVGGGRLLRHGILRDVRVERAARDGAPYLAVSVTLQQEEARPEPPAAEEEEITASRPR